MGLFCPRLGARQCALSKCDQFSFPISTGFTRGHGPCGKHGVFGEAARLDISHSLGRPVNEDALDS